MGRRRTIALAGAGAAIVATALSLALVLLLGGKPPAVAFKRAHSVTLPLAAKPGPLVSPFTGERIKALGPIIVVKIDNIVDARPPTGLTSADIVYLLPVEGGLSRIFAVYSSRFPPIIGPVRSAREDDLELLRQFGKPGFAYSGATPHLIPFIARARVFNLYNTPAYYRDPNRVAPHNYYAYSSMFLAEARGASKAHDIGFRFGPAPAGGRPVSSVSTSFPAASFTFRWSARTRHWLVSMDGKQSTDTTGGDLAASTVVIQYTVVRTSRFLEYGFRPPYAQSTGSGTAVVLRDGREYRVHWSRPNQNGGTTYTLPSGARMTFAPGQIWVVLTTTNWRTAGL
jgi:hypothetical protein